MSAPEPPWNSFRPLPVRGTEADVQPPPVDDEVETEQLADVALALSSLDIALALAATGLPVFPCTADKKPAIPRAKGGNGFHDASTDPDWIRELWDLAGAAGQLVGVPTGSASGFDVLDIDPRHGGDAWEIENSDRLGETRMHSTPSGGRHWPELTNRPPGTHKRTKWERQAALG